MNFLTIIKYEGQLGSPNALSKSQKHVQYQLYRR